LPFGYVFATQPPMRVANAYHRGDHLTEGEAHARLRAWMDAHKLAGRSTAGDLVP